MSSEYAAPTFVLIRHAQARSHDGLYGADTPLSDIGHRQAKATAKALSVGISIAAVYSSPFPRALDTAKPIAKRLDLELVIDDRLAEFPMDTAPLRSIEDRSDLLIWRPEHRGKENGETLAEFSKRVAHYCEEAALRHLGSSIAVITHAGVIDAAFRWSLGIDSERPWEFELDVFNASITEIEVWPHGHILNGPPRHTVVRRVADVNHLGNLISDI